MNNLRCLVIDDEPLAIDIIENYLARLENIEATRCENAIEALKLMRDASFDIIFLDIEMPLLTGLDFLKSLANPPAIIITTAYRDYAVEGFDFEVVDFLLKPISFARFMKGFERAVKTLKATGAGESSKKEDFLFLKVDKSHIKILVDDILFVESVKDYVRLKAKENEWISYQSLTAITEALPADKFLRIHRSFTIALNKVGRIKGNYVEIAGELIPISREQKAMAVKRIMNENAGLK
ncbi:LytR/AlgR family response regulator transcription factor [Flavitalea sp.]|nr:LytTR family DNA-binding domain-containing protein [Flavitalea sp.]